MTDYMVYTENEAEEKGLIQLTLWQWDRADEVRWLKKECERISSNKARTCILVKDNKGRLALYVNDVADRVELTSTKIKSPY